VGRWIAENKRLAAKENRRFATVRDTAHALGVSRRRTNQLIEIVERSLNPTSAHRGSQSSNERRVSIERKAASGHASRPNGSTKTREDSQGEALNGKILAFIRNRIN
jgi:hypothetical protein